MHKNSHMSASISISRKRKKICVTQRRFCGKFLGTILATWPVHIKHVNDDDQMKLGGSAQDFLQQAFWVRFALFAVEIFRIRRLRPVVVVVVIVVVIRFPDFAERVGAQRRRRGTTARDDSGRKRAAEAGRAAGMEVTIGETAGRRGGGRGESSAVHHPKQLLCCLQRTRAAAEAARAAAAEAEATAIQNAAARPRPPAASPSEILPQLGY